MAALVVVWTRLAAGGACGTDVVTAIFPVVAVAGTRTSIRSLPLGCTFVEGTPLNVTLVANMRLVPWIVTAEGADGVERAAPVGSNDVIAGVTVNFAAVSLLFPDGLCTKKVPMNGSAGTFTLSWVGPTWVISAIGPPLSQAWLTESRLVPFSVTIVPTGPDDGVNVVSVGGGARRRGRRSCL